MTNASSPAGLPLATKAVCKASLLKLCPKQWRSNESMSATSVVGCLPDPLTVMSSSR